MRNTDYLIVGGGVVGLSIAYQLLESGRQVTVVDQGPFAGGASAVNQGQISLLDRDPGAALDAARESLEFYHHLENEGFSVGLELQGGLMTLYSAAGMERAGKLMRRQRAAGLSCTVLEGKAIRSVEPNLNDAVVAGVLHCPEEGYLNPFRVTEFFIDALSAGGAELLPGMRVTGFRMTGERVSRVLTDEGDIEAGEVILATGSWSRELCALLGIDLPVLHHKGIMMTSSPYPRAVRNAIVSGGFFSDAGDGDRYPTFGCGQVSEGSIFMAQVNEYREDYDRTVPYQALCRIAADMLAHFPVLKDVLCLRGWAGVTTYTPGNNGFLGYSGVWENLFYAMGLKGAFSTAPAIGRIAAGQLLHGREAVRQWDPREAGL